MSPGALRKGRSRALPGPATVARCVVGERGFEPLKAEPTGLQPVPFGHLGTPPAEAHSSHALVSRTRLVPPIRGEAMDLNALLSAAVERGGSDLHLKVDS